LPKIVPPALEAIKSSGECEIIVGPALGALPSGKEPLPVAAVG